MKLLISYRIENFLKDVNSRHFPFNSLAYFIAKYVPHKIGLALVCKYYVVGTLRQGCPHEYSASASTSHPPHRQRQLTLEPFFLARLPGFLHAQGKHLQAATRNATAGRPPGNGTTPSSTLAATKKLGGALWAPYDRGARTSTAHDTQRHATPPEPVPLHVGTSTRSF